jgi:hypothetical protein
MPAISKDELASKVSAELSRMPAHAGKGLCVFVTGQPGKPNWKIGLHGAEGAISIDGQALYDADVIAKRLGLQYDLRED